MDIVERIKKLYNLSTRNSNSAEAAAAAAKIQELCFAHELELSKILEQGTDPKEPYIKYDFVLPDASNTDVGWKRSLFHGVCLSNFCQAVYIPKTTRLAVIGQKHNYEAVCYAYEYLAGEIIRLAVTECIKQHFLNNKDRRNYIRGFCEGATSEVRRALTASLRTQSQQTTESRALVVVKDEDLKKATALHFPHLRTTTRRVGGSSSGYSDGRRVGASIQVRRGVSNNGRVQIG